MVTRAFHADAVDLAYEDGPNGGRPAVMLHGVVRCGEDFEPILAPLILNGFHFHALDLRGHGASGRTPGAYRVVDYVADVVAFLERGVKRPAMLIGHSLGGMVAAAVAATVPDLVRAVVLEDPPFEMMGRRIAETSYLGLFRAYRDLLATTDSEEHLAAALAEIPVSVPSGGRTVRLGDQRDPAALRWLAACLRRVDPDVLTPILAGRWLDGFDTDGLLSRVACPALFLQADPSAGGTLPDDYAARLAGIMPDAWHIRMDGVGHNIHISRPDGMAELMTDFFDAI